MDGSCADTVKVLLLQDHKRKENDVAAGIEEILERELQVSGEDTGMSHQSLRLRAQS
jgi:hypothetical protein